MTAADSDSGLRDDGNPRRSVRCELAEESIRPRHAWYSPYKVVLDAVIAIPLLILTAPLVLLGAVLVKLTSRGPAFYLQTRLGRDGRQFTLVKLRTMVDNAEGETGPTWAEPDDPRITPVGRLLRGTHVDELPQLVSVLLGQMSLVGPRPERPEMVPKLQWHLPRYPERLQVRPGLTGMAQLRLPPDSDLESVRRKLVYDLYYVQFANPWLDARILLFTVVRVLGDVLKTFWRLVSIPRWEAVERCVPAVVDTEIAGNDANGNGNGNGGDAEWKELPPPIPRSQTTPISPR